jgi:hypothetical protein
MGVKREPAGYNGKAARLMYEAWLRQVRGIVAALRRVRPQYLGYQITN